MSERPTIHLVNPMWNPAGGSEWRTLELYRWLGEHADCLIWSEHQTAETFSGQAPIRTLNRETADAMNGGTLIIVGSYFPLGDWIHTVRPSRVIVIHNVFDPRLLQRSIRLLNSAGHQKVEIVYTSEVVATAAGLPGLVHSSPIDLTRFRPDPDGKAPGHGAPCTVGRLSRDVPQKHHPEDPALYTMLLESGFSVSLMGASSISEKLVQHPNLHLFQSDSMPAEEFLRSLDIFLFRTDPQLVEGFGRVITEAMACGVAVVAYRSGGYCEFLQHGENALLFSATKEAEELITKLRYDRQLYERITRGALKTVHELNSAAQRNRHKLFYLAEQACRS